MNFHICIPRNAAPPVDTRHLDNGRGQGPLFTSNLRWGEDSQPGRPTPTPGEGRLIPVGHLLGVQEISIPSKIRFFEFFSVGRTFQALSQLSDQPLMLHIRSPCPLTPAHEFLFQPTLSVFEEKIRKNSLRVSGFTPPREVIWAVPRPIY